MWTLLDVPFICFICFISFFSQHFISFCNGDHCCEKNVEYLVIIERELMKNCQLHLLIQVILNHTYSQHVQSRDSGRDAHMIIIIILCTPLKNYYYYFVILFLVLCRVCKTLCYFPTQSGESS